MFYLKDKASKKKWEKSTKFIKSEFLDKTFLKVGKYIYQKSPKPPLKSPSWRKINNAFVAHLKIKKKKDFFFVLTLINQLTKMVYSWINLLIYLIYYFFIHYIHSRLKYNVVFHYPPIYLFFLQKKVMYKSQSSNAFS